MNKVSLRDVHHVKTHFQQARSIPPGTWKSVTDAWNGYHLIPIREEDRHYTTFITPWGRFQYRMLPQGFLAIGDKYSQRYDNIIADVERKSKCVYDTIRNKLHVVDSVVVMIDELSPPSPSLRPEILSSLHAAHQGTTGMNES